MPPSKLNHSPCLVRDWRMKPVMGGCWASGWDHCRTTPAEVWLADSVTGGFSLLLLSGGSEAGEIRKSFNRWAGYIVWKLQLREPPLTFQPWERLSQQTHHIQLIVQVWMFTRKKVLNEKCTTHHPVCSWHWCYFYYLLSCSKLHLQRVLDFLWSFSLRFQVLCLVSTLWPRMIKYFQGQKQH